MVVPRYRRCSVTSPEFDTVQLTSSEPPSSVAVSEAETEVGALGAVLSTGAALPSPLSADSWTPS